MLWAYLKTTNTTNAKSKLLEGEQQQPHQASTYEPPMPILENSHKMEQKKSLEEKKQTYARMCCERQIRQTVIKILMTKDQQTVTTLKIILKNQTDSLAALGGNLSDNIKNLLKEEEITNENRSVFSFINP